MYDHDVIERFLQRLDCSARDDVRTVLDIQRLIRSGCAQKDDLSELEFYKNLFDLNLLVRGYVRGLVKED